MLRRRLAGVALLALLMVMTTGSVPAQAGYGFCLEPRAPSLFASRPSKPYCAISRSCEQWQVDSYNSEVNRYFDALKNYLVDVDSYRKKAYEYAECMADLD